MTRRQQETWVRQLAGAAGATGGDASVGQSSSAVGAGSGSAEAGADERAELQLGQPLPLPWPSPPPPLPQQRARRGPAGARLEPDQSKFLRQAAQAAVDGLADADVLARLQQQKAAVPANEAITASRQRPVNLVLAASVYDAVAGAQRRGTGHDAGEEEAERAVPGGHSAEAEGGGGVGAGRGGARGDGQRRAESGEGQGAASSEDGLRQHAQGGQAASVAPHLVPACPRVRAAGRQHVGGSSARPSSTSMGASHDSHMTAGGPGVRAGAGSSEAAHNSGAAGPLALASAEAPPKRSRELAGHEARQQAEGELEPRPPRVQQPEGLDEWRQQGPVQSPPRLQRDELQPLRSQQPQQQGTASSQGHECGGPNQEQAPQYPPVALR